MSRIVDSYLSILLTRFLDNHQEKEKLYSRVHIFVTMAL